MYTLSNVNKCSNRLYESIIIIIKKKIPKSIRKYIGEKTLSRDL